jgi:hypothetical protein
VKGKAHYKDQDCEPAKAQEDVLYYLIGLQFCEEGELKALWNYGKGEIISANAEKGGVKVDGQRSI